MSYKSHIEKIIDALQERDNQSITQLSEATGLSIPIITWAIGIYRREGGSGIHARYSTRTKHVYTCAEAGGNVKQIKRPTNQEEIIGDLTLHGPSSAAEISRRLIIPYNSVKDTISSIRKARKHVIRIFNIVQSPGSNISRTTVYEVSDQPDYVMETSKERSVKLVLDYLQQHETVTITEMVKLKIAARTTAHKVVDKLIDDGLIKVINKISDNNSTSLTRVFALAGFTRKMPSQTGNGMYGRANSAKAQPVAIARARAALVATNDPFGALFTRLVK